MGNGRRSKSRFALAQQRKQNVLEERKLYLILTEGATEKTYLDHFASTTGPDVQVIDQGDSRRSIVQEAINLRQRYADRNSYQEDIDETWVVFDRDVDATNTFDKGQINDALNYAKQNNVKVAFSNDSFELWFLVHFQDMFSALHRTVILEKLNTHLGGEYVKGKSGDIFDVLLPNLPRAIKRAEAMLKAMEDQGIQPVDACPSTTVHILVKGLLNNAGHPYATDDTNK